MRRELKVKKLILAREKASVVPGARPGNKIYLMAGGF
jgi:hypothetical protein